MKLRTLGLILGCVIGATVGYAKAAEPVVDSTPETITLSAQECEQVAIEVSLSLMEEKGYKMDRDGLPLTANAAIVAARIKSDNPGLSNQADPGEIAELLFGACVAAHGETDIPVTH